MTGRGTTQNDFMKIYRLAYKQEYNWSDYIDDDKMKFFDILWKGRCVHPSMAIPAFMTSVSSLSGPNAKIQAHPHSTSSPLILYMFSICAPGGGKSTSFETVVLPAGEVFEKDVGKTLLIENYTQAGLQNHQFDCDGYGLLASDEGIRVLSAIHGKQVKNEGERQFLCKSWNGLGDYTLLREKERGYSRTALSMLLYMQPEPFLGEWRHFSEDDGLRDRCIVTTVKPRLFQSGTLSKNAELFNRNYGKVIETLYKGVYDWHKGTTRVYTFDEAAQDYYNEISDEIVREFNDLFNSDDDETFMLSQDTSSNITSKDVVQIARCAGCLHIFFTSLDRVLDKRPVTIPNHIPLTTMKLAHHFYTIAAKQKAIFTEALMKTEKNKNFLTTEVRTTYQKVVRAVYKMDGPFVIPREIAKKMSGVYAHVVREELITMERNGLGTLKRRGQDGIPKETFFKVPPGDLSNYDESLTTSDMTIVTYTQHYKNMSIITKLNLKRLQKWNPHKDEIDMTYNSLESSLGDEIHVLHDISSDVQNSQQMTFDITTHSDNESVASSILTTVESPTFNQRLSKNKGVGRKSSKGQGPSTSIPITISSNSSLDSLHSNLENASPNHHSTPLDELLPQCKKQATDSNVHLTSQRENEYVYNNQLGNSLDTLSVDNIIRDVVLPQAHTNDIENDYVIRSSQNVVEQNESDHTSATSNTIKVTNKNTVSKVTKQSKGGLIKENKTLNWSRPREWDKVLAACNENANVTNSNSEKNEKKRSTVSTCIQTDDTPVSDTTGESSTNYKGKKVLPTIYSPPKLRSQKMKRKTSNN